MKHHEPIKVGRIARAIERALDISLTGEVAIYMKEEEINAMAAKRPSSYLKQLEEIGSILKNPDFVCFDAEKETFVFTRSYIREGILNMVYLKVKRLQQRWYVHGIENGMKAALPISYQDAMFVRPQYKKLPEAA